jgi:hypothetical protein
MRSRVTAKQCAAARRRPSSIACGWIFFVCQRSLPPTLRTSLAHRSQQQSASRPCWGFPTDSAPRQQPAPPHVKDPFDPVPLLGRRPAPWSGPSVAGASSSTFCERSVEPARSPPASHQQTRPTLLSHIAPPPPPPRDGRHDLSRRGCRSIARPRRVPCPSPSRCCRDSLALAHRIPATTSPELSHALTSASGPNDNSALESLDPPTFAQALSLASGVWMGRPIR